MPDGKQSQEQFASKVNSFPHTTPERRKKQIVEGFPKVSVGMSKQQVEALLGDPDYSDIIGSNSWFGMKPHGTDWTYCLYCTSKFVGTFGDDRAVSVLFDLDGKVRWAVPHGVAGLTENGGPWSSK